MNRFKSYKNYINFIFLVSSILYLIPHFEFINNNFIFNIINIVILIIFNVYNQWRIISILKINKKDKKIIFNLYDVTLYILYILIIIKIFSFSILTIIDIININNFKKMELIFGLNMFSISNIKYFLIFQLFINSLSLFFYFIISIALLIYIKYRKISFLCFILNYDIDIIFESENEYHNLNNNYFINIMIDNILINLLHIYFKIINLIFKFNTYLLLKIKNKPLEPPYIF